MRIDCVTFARLGIVMREACANYALRISGEIKVRVWRMFIRVHLVG